MYWQIITVTSYWARWRLISPASGLFAEPFFRRRLNKTYTCSNHKSKCIYWQIIAVTSYWARRRLISPASGLFAEPFFRRRLNKTSEFRVTGLCGGIRWGRLFSFEFSWYLSRWFRYWIGVEMVTSHAGSYVLVFCCSRRHVWYHLD